MKKRDYEINPIDLSELKISYDIAGSPADSWQKEVLEYWGDIAIRAGRQVGKSAVMAKKAAIAALKYTGFHILVSASSERQAAYIFEKIKYELKTVNQDVFANTPTMRLMKLKNGTEIYCLPTGLTGDLVRGLTLNIWIPDEAAYINPQVRVSIDPMLWLGRKAGNGWTWALSTPNGKEGFFWELFNTELNPTFRTWHIKSTDCERILKEELEKWKRNYTKVQYAQEVLGEFIDEVSRLFPQSLLDACFKKDVIPWLDSQKMLGVDVARFGGDSNAFVNSEINDLNKIRVTIAEETQRVAINDTFKKIVELNNKYDYNKILIDDAGVGGGLADFLIEKLGDKIICTNNAQRITDSDGKKGKLLKEVMYSNAILQMEQGNVEILEDENLRLSLSSMQFEWEGETLKIHGRYSHLAEAFIRSLWGCKAKGLNMFVHWF